MNIQTNPRLQHQLAAEYVLGTLRGGARRRFQQWLRVDPHLQQVVREWEQHLMPMMEFSRAQQPQSHVWHNIEQQLKLKANMGKHAMFNFFDSVNFWRNFSLMTSIALLLITVILIKPQELSPATEMYVATLTDEQVRPIAVVSSDVKHRQVLLRFINRPQIAANKSLELWSISKEGKVRSLGLVSELADQQVLRLTLPEEVGNDTPQLLAISLEPKGGAGNPYQPSGPILFKGNWLKTT